MREGCLGACSYFLALPLLDHKAYLKDANELVRMEYREESIVKGILAVCMFIALQETSAGMFIRSSKAMEWYFLLEQ